MGRRHTGGAAVNLDTDEVRQLVALADSNKSTNRIAEHLWRVLIALAAKKTDTELARQHAVLAAKRLLELKG